jgi:hypothetical protein
MRPFSNHRFSLFYLIDGFINIFIVYSLAPNSIANDDNNNNNDDNDNNNDDNDNDNDDDNAMIVDCAQKAMEIDVDDDNDENDVVVRDAALAAASVVDDNSSASGRASTRRRRNSRRKQKRRRRKRDVPAHVRRAQLRQYAQVFCIFSLSLFV